MRFCGTPNHALNVARKTINQRTPGVQTEVIDLKKLDTDGHYNSLTEALANEDVLDDYNQVMDEIVNPINDLNEEFSVSDNDEDMDWNLNKGKVIFLGLDQKMGSSNWAVDGGAVLQKNGKVQTMAVSAWSDSYWQNKAEPGREYAYESKGGTKTYVLSTPEQTTQVKLRGKKMTIKRFAHTEDVQFASRPNLDKSVPQPLDAVDKVHYTSVQDAQEGQAVLSYYQDLEREILDPVLNTGERILSHDGYSQDKAEKDDHVILVNYGNWQKTDAEAKFKNDDYTHISSRSFSSERERDNNGSGTIAKLRTRGNVETYELGRARNNYGDSAADYEGREVKIDYKHGTFQEFDIEGTLGDYTDH